MRSELLDESGHLIDSETVDEVDGAEQIVPRIGRENLRRLALAAGNVIDLEPELDRQPPLLRLDDRTDVAVEVVDAALEHRLLVPEVPRLLEVVHVLGEADLVDAAIRGRLDVSLHRRDRVVDPLVWIAQVHVIVDDHRKDATSSRSERSVTFRSVRSPGTVATRPRVSTSDAQSVAPARSPPRASRRADARNACGV